MLKQKAPMYSFKIKADALDIDIPAVRSLLVLAAIIIAVSRNNTIYAVNIVACIVLLMAAFIAEVILVKYRVHTLLVIGAAALLLGVCTFNIIFPAIMMAAAFAVRHFYVPPTVQASENGIRIKKTFADRLHEWASFNHIVLKDGLLTLDFKNNKVLQLEIAGTADENSFNSFCAEKLMGENSAPGKN